MSVLCIFLALSLLYQKVLLASASKRVNTEQGFVRGTLDVVQFNDGPQHTVYKFLGIPYAKKPTGDLRFKRPQPLKDQRPNDYDATKYRPVCLQIPFYFRSVKLAWPEFDPSKEAYMSEDCLYLNIYTPSTNCPSKKYPVMVHIHGGSYVAGTPVRDISPGEYLPRHNVVLVTIQYRLGAFGFFTTGDSEAPGNLGLLDQVESLKWIHKNIGNFCGDKNSVTLVGESAGGSSVSLHYLSPLSKGLFHRGIAVSGVALTFFALKPKPTVLEGSKTLIKGLGCERQTTQLTLTCLQSKTSGDVIKNNKDLLKVQPFVDNYFLPDEPRKLLQEGRFHKLPLMSGFVSNEGTNGISEPEIPNITAYRNYLDKTFFSMPYLRFTKQQAPLAFDALALQYKPRGYLKTPKEYQKNVIDLLSDYTVIAATHDVLTFHSEHVANTYMFEFAHRSLHHPGPKWKGVVHEDTTAYKFGLPLLKSARTSLTFNDDDRSVSKKMVKLFTNFAKCGEPGKIFPDNGKQFEWTAFNTFNKAYLKIQKTVAMTSKYHPSRMAFWNCYFPTLLPCKGGYAQCKKSEDARPSKARDKESDQGTLVQGAPNPEIVLW